MVTLKTVKTGKVYEVYMPMPTRRDKQEAQDMYLGSLVRLNKHQWVAISSVIAYSKPKVFEGPRRDAVNYLLSAVGKMVLR